MEPDLQLCGHPPVVPRGEPLENSLCLPFPGGYYLTSAYGALSLIKNFQEEQAARLLSSEARDTLRQWHKRRTTNRTVPSVDDFQVRGQQPGWAQLLPHGPCGSGTSPTPPPAPLCLIIQWKGDILNHLLTLLFHFSLFLRRERGREREKESVCVCVCVCVRVDLAQVLLPLRKYQMRAGFPPEGSAWILSTWALRKPTGRMLLAQVTCHMETAL